MMIAINALLLLVVALVAQAASSENRNLLGEVVIEGGPGTYPPPERDSRRRVQSRPRIFDSIFSSVARAIDSINTVSAQLNAPLHESAPTILASDPISVAETNALVPKLLVHLEVLQPALTTIRTNEIVIAALKIHSLIPDYVIVEENSASESGRAEQISKPEDELNEMSVPNYRTFLINFLHDLIKKLPEESKTSAINQIKSFYSYQFLYEFIAEKETEITQKLAESVHSIIQLKLLLSSTSETLSGTFTANSLALITSILESVMVSATMSADETARSIKSLSDVLERI